MMLKTYRNTPKLALLFLLVLLVGASCKSRKKTAEMNAAAAEKAKMEQEAIARQKQADEQKARDAEEQARRDAAAKQQASKVSTPAVRLSQYFDAISTSGNIGSANSSINEAMSLFDSPDTPVLIIISDEGGQKDYDKPTTIKAYLNYLKDQKKNMNKVENLQFNDAGKITEVELKKN